MNSFDLKRQVISSYVHFILSAILFPVYLRKPISFSFLLRLSPGPYMLCNIHRFLFTVEFEKVLDLRKNIFEQHYKENA